VKGAETNKSEERRIVRAKKYKEFQKIKHITKHHFWVKTTMTSSISSSKLEPLRSSHISHY